MNTALIHLVRLISSSMNQIADKNSSIFVPKPSGAIDVIVDLGETGVLSESLSET